MKHFFLFLFILGATLGLRAQESTAGSDLEQPEGIGQAGALQLMMNGFPRSAALMGLNVATTSGIESSFLNPAGTGTTRGTELLFANTQYMIGSDVSINSFGLSQALGNGSVLGLVVNQVNPGEIVRTTVQNPDGTLGTFTPNHLNIGVNYAKQFTDRIYVGALIRIISESTPEVSAGGVSFDAGIQYRTGRKKGMGDRDRVKLGIALRNVGPTMTYGGDGLIRRVFLSSRNSFDTGVELPAAEFELPVILSMGASYDLIFKPDQALTLLGAFNSNTFFSNEFGIGLEYSYKEFFAARASYLYREGALEGNTQASYDAHSGLGAGVSLGFPFDTGRTNSLGEEVPSRASLDIAFRPTNTWSGSLTVGFRIDL